MKTLILVRHAKSSWEYSVGDKDRPLLEVGINDAIRVSNTFQQQKTSIDAVFSSPANRAIHTSMIFCRQLHFPMHNYRVTERLYDFSGDAVVEFVKQLDNDLMSVMIFGHNDAFTNIANSLGNSYIDNVPTSGLVHLQFSVEKWSELEKGSTIQKIFPKQIRE
ncbi:MAG: histidine phosphatase family protein [Flavobacteriaceae bacterium]